MTPTGLVLGLLLSTAWAEGPAGRGEAPSSQDEANDPWSLLTLADRLAQQGGRQDELVAVLVAALEEPATRQGAADKLLRVLLTEAPRNAWSDAYMSLMPHVSNQEARAVQLRAALAGLDQTTSRKQSMELLRRRLAQDPGDREARLALGDAYLRNGESERALKVFREERSDSQVWRGEVAALLALGRYDEAMRTGAEIVPASCKSTRMPAPCAVGLQQLGYPEAAIESLERAREREADGARSRGEKANLYATQARIQERLTNRADTVRLWEQAVLLEPRDRTYAVGLIEALLEAGRVSEARRRLPTPDDPMARAIDAVALATSVDLDSREPAVAETLDRARQLDGSHPIVLRAWAHHLIVSGQPDEAARLLEAGTRARAEDYAWVELYTWATWKAGRTDQAVEMLRVALSSAPTEARWYRAAADMARFNGILAEQNKSAGRTDPAQEQYLLAHAMDRRSVSYLVGMGGVAWQAGDLSTAERAYRKAWTMAPGNRQALMALVSLLKAQGREDEARGILSASGYSDVMARRLERELEMLEISRDARMARDAGRYGEARGLYENLLALYPNEITLLHALADTLSEMKLYEQAAETYGQARDIDPEDPWLAMGEINSRVALDQLDRARYLLARMDEPRDGDAREAWLRTQSNVKRAEADRLTRGGDARGAFELYKTAITDRPDPVLYTGLAALYLSRWQYNAAQAWYEEALGLDPEFDEAERGIIRAQASRGDLAEAQRRVSALCARQPTRENIALAEEVERKYAISEAAGAAVIGNMDQARRILEDQLDAYPGDLELRVAMAALMLKEGEAEAAYDQARLVLDQSPAHPGALAALQAAGLKLRRTADVLEAYEKARKVSKETWLGDEILALELASRLDKAREAHKAGSREAADAIIHEAIRTYGDSRSRHWVLIGSAWLDLGRHDEALAAFETAQHMDPDDAGGVVGLASTYLARGQLSEAEDALQEYWAEHKDPEVGVALAQVQAERGRPMAAGRTLEEVKLEAKRGRVNRSRQAPEPLPVAPLPSGRTVEAEDPEAVPPDANPVLPDVNLQKAEEGLKDPYRGSVAVGAGIATRPGLAGEQFLRLQYVPIAGELAVLGPVRLQAEVVPVRITDGVREANGFSGSAGFATARNEAVSAYGRVGTSPSGDGFAIDPYLTWAGGVSGRLSGRFDAGLETARAPVTDTFTSFAGARDPLTGQVTGGVHDTWIGGQLSHYWPNKASAGVLARWGESQGPNLAIGGAGEGAVAWEQAVIWARAPLQDELDRSVWLGFEGIAIDHDRQVDGFAAGQGGMFSPDAFYSGMVRLEARWGIDPAQKLQACGLIGAGPQQVLGQPTLFLNPGTYLGYELRGSLHYDLGKNFGLVAHAVHQGSWVVWGQNAGLVQLRYGRKGTSLPAPSAAFASSAHGPPLLEQANCGLDWKEGAR